MISVLGIPLAAGATERIAAAKLVVGAARHLSTVDSVAEQVVLGDVPAAVERLVAHDGPAVVLASGDPGFFGIVRALRAAGLDVEVLPAPSSVAVAFARLGVPWDDALVVSAHGRSLRPVVHACRAHRKVAVLTGPGTGPAELGAALRDLPRRLVVAERLGAADERVTETTPAAAAAAQWRDPNVVLVLGADPVAAAPGWVAGNPPGPAGWALPEAAFAHRDSMITKAEVRALALARLGPRLGDLVWDIGAGSGSVAVECARFGAAVLAVERDPVACQAIRDNARGHGVELAVVEAAAPRCLAELPDPDAVFVGGGGLDVLRACAARRPARLVVALTAVERVGAALAAMRAAGYDTEGVQLQANRVALLPDGTHRLAATNPVHLVSGVPR
jgi:precorrin-6B C5,15-methyltransferase / cobalt-precorrin-6B C5,C15-methyltransferase